MYRKYENYTFCFSGLRFKVVSGRILRFSEQYEYIVPILKVKLTKLGKTLIVLKKGQK